MNWQHLIDIAQLLAGQGALVTRGRPRQMMLKKAISAAYYAMFHALCYSNANVLIGSTARAARLPAWTRTYRALDHGAARDRLLQRNSSVSPAVQSFGTAFSVLQSNRNKADYDPNSRFHRGHAVSLIDRSEDAIQAFLSSGESERRELAAAILMRGR